MQIDKKDLTAGLLLLAIAGFFLIHGWVNLPMGSSFRMGPGYFPVALAILLAGFGATLTVRAVGRPSASFGAVPWRGILMTTAASVAIGLGLPYAGLVPTLFCAVLLSAFASQRMTVRLALMLAGGLTIFCVVVFRYALEMPVSLIGPG